MVECMISTEKYVLIKKIFTNEQNINLPLWVRVKKIVHGVRKYQPSGKKKSSGHSGQ